MLGRRRVSSGSMASTTAPHPASSVAKRGGFRRQVSCCSMVTKRLYEWSFQTGAAPSPEEEEVQVEPSSWRDVNAVLGSLTAAAESAASSPQRASVLSLAAVGALQDVLPPSSLSTTLTAPQAASLLSALARLRARRSGLPPQWLQAVLAGPLAAPAAAACCSTSLLAEAAWAVSELSEATGPGSSAASWASGLLAEAAPRLSEFYGPDLAGLVCACGVLLRDPLLWSAESPTADAAAASAAKAPVQAGLSEPTAGWKSELAAEATFQLGAFAADLSAFDIARLVLGLADLSVPIGAPLRAAITKAVYSKSGTIEQKAAMDFALARLETGGRSLHFDPRWTHEELNWLPRRERDKRRIMKENWVRTQWGGYR